MSAFLDTLRTRVAARCGVRRGPGVHPLAIGFAMCGLCACQELSAPRVPVLSSLAPGAGEHDAGASPASGEDSAADRSRPVRATDDGVDHDAGTSLPNGARCYGDEDCLSQHCRNDVCCESGECCKGASDCSAGTPIAITCEDPAACQGARGPAQCLNFRCSARGGDDDDSACDSRVIADECGPFAPIYCTGEAEQRKPRCPDTCNNDSDCDRSAHCDSTCLPDVPKGAACDENSDCESGQCNGGRCCVEGNCTRDLGEAPETIQRQCLETLASDACSRCGCTLCTASMLSCYNSGSETRDSLCSTLLECAFRERCFDACLPGQDCYRAQCWCGAECKSPSGSCTRPIEAAAGGANSAEALEERAKDGSHALFYAERYGECLNVNCRNECGL